MAGGETIVAIATPPGTGAVSMIRLSGGGALSIGREAFGGHLPKARRVSLRKIVDAEGEMIDEGVACVYEGPASYTGEDVVEFTGHGGVVVTRQVMERLVELGGASCRAGGVHAACFFKRPTRSDSGGGGDGSDLGADGAGIAFGA